MPTGLPHDPDITVTNPEWVLHFCNFADAWKLPPKNHAKDGKIYPGKIMGEGIVIVHPDTGWTKHPELLQDYRYLISDSAEYNYLDLSKSVVDSIQELNPEPTSAEDGLNSFWVLLHPGHGTATASVIMSAKGHPNKDSEGNPLNPQPFKDYDVPEKIFITGVAPKVVVMPFKVARSVILWDEDDTSLANVINQAIRLSCNYRLGKDPKKNVGVISISPGSLQFGAGTKALRDALRDVREEGIAALLRDSPVAEGAVGAGWRRVARPLGAIGRRQGRPPGEQSQILARMNRAKATERLSPAPPPPTSTKLGTPSRIGQAVVPGWDKLSVTDRSRALARRLGQRGTAGSAAAGVLFLLHGPRDPQSPNFVHAVSPRPDFVAVETSINGGEHPGPGITGIGGHQDSPSARAFRQAAAVLLQHVEAEMKPEVEPKPVALAELRQKLVDDLDPRRTIGAALQARLQIADGLQWQPTDQLEPILVGPEFPQPMYKPLAELSQDWLLPGLDQVPANTVTLIETNQRFVEAYMLGPNHEMGRELFWQEYPTDQRRTYFRQFWDPSSFVPLAGQPLDREKLKDIRPIHRWRSSAVLGQNSGRTAATGEQLVLLVRGDVIQRYPNLIVYATRAVWTADKQHGLGDEERQPVFSGTLKPDIAFFGFALTEEHARGDSTEPGLGDPGWFFVLQEQPGEPRFGLDIGAPGDARPKAWKDLHWGHLVAAGQEQTTIDYINLDADRPDTRAISDPPGVAWHADHGLGSKGAQASDLAFITLQRPVRVAIHATDMLPSES
jgi:hypothetical protein